MARTLAKARERAPAREAEILAQVVTGAAQLHRNGRMGEAAALYERILQLKPDYFDALHLLGVIRQQQGQGAEALRLIDAALRVVPGSADALSNRGVVLKALDRLDDALTSYDAALAVNPEQFDALVNRARALTALDRHDEALTACNAVLGRMPNHCDALRNRGGVLMKLDRPEDALATYELLLAMQPNDLETLNNRAIVLVALNRFDEALASLKVAVARDPHNVGALNNRGNVLNRLNRYTEALLDYDKALAQFPDHADALNNRGVALAELNRFEEALASFAGALAVAPDNAEIHYSQSLALLTLGKFHAGWRGYEWRWKSPRWRHHQRNFLQPQWRGDVPVEGKTVLLHAEQGLGDALQFVRYAPLLARRGANVVVEVSSPLKTLLAGIRSIKVVARGENLPGFDLHCPLMSLPFAFGTQLSTIPAEIPYVPVPQDRVGQWRDRLGERRAPRVGVVWSGSASHERNRSRSIPLDRFGAILSTPGIQFVSLQRDLTPHEGAALGAYGAVIDIGEELTDFADAAALISLLDIVVSVDTAVAHLAGAMGKPVWILLPFSPDYRWMLDRDDSPWYPSARLFRQTTIGDWEMPLGNVRRGLVSLAERG